MVAAAEEADLEAELAADEAPEADEPVVEALVWVGDAEPVRVVSVAVVVLLPLAAVPVLVSVELSVAFPDEAVDEEPAAVEEQATVAGRSVTPPPAQMPLATWIVVSWSAWEHLPATQQAMLLRKDLSEQMHWTLRPQLAGMELVAQDFAQSGRASRPWAEAVASRAAARAN